MVARLITADDLEQLSAWAIVALYARASLRALPAAGYQMDQSRAEDAARLEAAALASLRAAIAGGFDAGSEASLGGLARVVNQSETAGRLAAGAMAATLSTSGVSDLDVLVNELSEPDNIATNFTDLEFLVDRSGGGSPDDRSMPAPRELTEYPLWPDGPPFEVAELSDELVKNLQRFGQSDAAQIYQMLSRGKPDWGRIERFLGDLAEFGEVSTDPSTTTKDQAATKSTGSGGGSPPPDPPRLSMIADEALQSDADDRLGFGDYANSLADLIHNPKTGTPLTLAINAPWGAGKTTLARMVERRLIERKSHVTCWFNAWLHDEAGDLAGAFAGVVAREANRNRPRWRRIISPVPLSLLSPTQRLTRRLWFLAIVILLALGISLWGPESEALDQFSTWALQQSVGAKALVNTSADSLRTYDIAMVSDDADTTRLSIAVNQSAPSPEDSPFEGGVWSWFLSSLGILAGLGKLANMFSPVARSLAEFVQNRQKTSNEQSLNEVRSQLRKLIRQGTPDNSRFVIFVDDLERCQPPRPVEVMEVVSQLLAHQDVVTVIVADMPAVAACAEIKYEALAQRYQPSGGTALRTDESSSRQAYGRLYLQKIVQLQFDLPSQATGQIEKLIKDYVVEQEEVEQGNAEEPSDDKSSDTPSLVARAGGILQPASNDHSSEESIEELIKEAWRSKIWLIGVLRSLLAIVAVSFLWSVQAGRKLGYPTTRRGHLSNRSGLDQFVYGVNYLGCFGYMYFVVLYWSLCAYNSHLFNAYAASVPVVLLPVVLLFNGFFAYAKFRGDRAMVAVVEAEIDQTFRRAKDVDAVTEALKDSSFAKQIDLAELIQERERFYVTSDSELMAEAERAALEFVPPLPRNAKRFLNRLRLVLSIAYQRGVFVGEPVVTARHVAKWAVLQERWPELAQALGTKPEFIDDLEGSLTDSAALRSTIERLAPSYVEDDDLAVFLKKETFGAPVLSRLVRFERMAEAD